MNGVIKRHFKTFQSMIDNVTCKGHHISSNGSVVLILTGGLEIGPELGQLQLELTQTWVRWFLMQSCIGDLFFLVLF